MKIARVTFSRVRYFSGQLLTASDFQAEQSYLRDKQRFINRSTYGIGIVCGLSVTTEAGGRSLHLSPGLAMDGFGREICVPSPVDCTLPTAGSRIRVSVRYTEAESAPRQGHGALASEEPGSEPTRVDEGFELSVDPIPAGKTTGGQAGLPLPCGSDDSVLLGMLRRKGTRWVVDPPALRAPAKPPGTQSKTRRHRRS